MAPWPAVAEREDLERVHYFPRQLLTAEDMRDEQTFFLQKLRRHNRFLHGWGVVCGCRVEAAALPSQPWRVKIAPGYAIDPAGNEIYVGEDYFFNLATGSPDSRDPCVPCPPRSARAADRPTAVFLAIRYAICEVRPVRVHPAGCACDEAACEYSRTRDDFRVTVLGERPSCMQKAEEADLAWRTEFKKWLAAADPRASPPARSCPDCADEPWVVLASIPLPASATDALGTIDNAARRTVYSTSGLEQVALAAM